MLDTQVQSMYSSFSYGRWEFFFFSLILNLSFPLRFILRRETNRQAGNRCLFDEAYRRTCYEKTKENERSETSDTAGLTINWTEREQFARTVKVRAVGGGARADRKRSFKPLRATSRENLVR